MKKGILITAMVIGALSLTAIGIVKQKESTKDPIKENEISISATTTQSDENIVIPLNDFALDIGPRFLATVSKADLDKATSISEIIPEDAGWDKYFFSKTHVRIVKSNMDIVGEEKGYNLNLTEAQLTLLKSAKYSDDLQFGTSRTSNMDMGSLNYMVTVVPEKQTVYQEGAYELISHLRNKVFNLISLQKNKRWDAGKIKFTVNGAGIVSDVNLISSSGNKTVDEQMIRSISELPARWIPAENANGEKVDQVLTLSFGSMGC